jgi:hypothetical protein
MATTQEPSARRRLGRPPLGLDVGKRAPLSLRTTRQLKRDLEHRSNETGRSIAQEVEYCLEAWLALEQVFGGPRMAALFRLMAAAAALIEAEVGRGSTMTNYQTFCAVEEAWKQIISDARPLPDAEVLERIDELRRLVDTTPQPPQYPDVPPPQFPSGFGLLETAEERYEREAPIRVWQQHNAKWQAEMAAHQQKIDAAMSKFKRLEEIGREAAWKTTDPHGNLRSTLVSLIASGPSVTGNDA